MLTRLGIMPEQASTLAPRVDALYYFLLGVSLFFGLLIATLIVVFAVRFRRRPDRPTGMAIEGSLLLEGLWTSIPFAIGMVIFVWGASVFFAGARPPDGSLEIFVVGKQWMWKLQHMEGKREINELHVPVGRPVKLTMTSEDVIHSFFVPAFRVKADAVPGRYTTLWFEATRPGSYHLFCAEYCGTQHSRMIGRVVAMEPAAYQAWLTAGPATVAALDEEPAGTIEEKGRRVFDREGCASCHRVDDATSRLAIGPALAGLFGRTIRLADGSSRVVDESYVRQSILTPMAAVVEGYQPVMPTYRGRVSEEELLQLIAYVKSLEAGVGARTGEEG